MTGAAGTKADTSLSNLATELEFDFLTGDRIPRWIAHHATSALGIGITEPAVELLQAAVGSDLHQLAGELDKLASYVQGRGGEIGEDAVAAIVGVRRGETQADLLDAVADRNASRSLELIPHVLAQPKTTAVSVVMALSTQMLAFRGEAPDWTKAFQSSLAQEYFDLLKETCGAFTRPVGGPLPPCGLVQRNAGARSTTPRARFSGCEAT